MLTLQRAISILEAAKALRYQLHRRECTLARLVPRGAVGMCDYSTLDEVLLDLRRERKEILAAKERIRELEANASSKAAQAILEIASELELSDLALG